MLQSYSFEAHDDYNVEDNMKEYQVTAETDETRKHFENKSVLLIKNTVF